MIPDKFFEKKILTPRAMETHIQISYKDGKLEERKEMCARTLNGSEQLSLRYIDFSCSMLDATPVTNAFLSYTWLSKCCFFWCFFSYILNTFLFYRLFDNVLMKTYSLCDPCGDKKAFKETKIRGVIASKRILFKGSFCWAKKRIEYLIFHLLFTLRITKK